MRKNIVAGNWKMNTTLQEGVALAKEIDAALAGVSTKCDVIIATPFTHLVSVVNAVDTKRIGVGAENCADKTEGAYTGEVSAKMVAFIRKTIADKYGKEVAENTSILYGGSCKPSNAAELFAKPDVDGGLIGGAALKADSFMGIITAF